MIASQFDLQSGVPVETTADSTGSDEADVRRIVSVVQSRSRHHADFAKLKSDPWHNWAGRNLRPG